MSRRRYRFVLAASAAILFSTLASDAFAFPGVTGRTSTGCAGSGCHGAQSATITTSGPASLAIGQTGTYTLTFSGSTKTGANVAATGGTLAPVTAQFTLSGGELTFTSARTASTWQFTYTPTSSGTKTIAAAGVVNGHPGTWNFANVFSVSVSATAVESDGQPLGFALAQNYPNPFNPSTLLEFSLPASGPASLIVYDLEGRAVATLADGIQAAGLHAVTFDAAGLASGIYFARLSADGKTAARKLILVR